MNCLDYGVGIYDMHAAFFCNKLTYKGHLHEGLFGLFLEGGKLRQTQVPCSSLPQEGAPRDVCTGLFCPRLRTRGLANKPKYPLHGVCWIIFHPDEQPLSSEYEFQGSCTAPFTNCPQSLPLEEGWLHFR